MLSDTVSLIAIGLTVQAKFTYVNVSKAAAILVSTKITVSAG